MFYEFVSLVPILWDSVLLSLPFWRGDQGQQRLGSFPKATLSGGGRAEIPTGTSQARREPSLYNLSVISQVVPQRPPNPMWWPYGTWLSHWIIRLMTSWEGVRKRSANTQTSFRRKFRRDTTEARSVSGQLPRLPWTFSEQQHVCMCAYVYVLCLLLFPKASWATEGFPNNIRK